MKASFVQSVNKAMYAIIPHLVTLTVIGTYYAQGGVVSLPVVFQTLALMFAVRFELIETFPNVVQLSMEAHVGLQRIEVSLF